MLCLSYLFTTEVGYCNQKFYANYFFSRNSLLWTSHPLLYFHLIKIINGQVKTHNSTCSHKFYVNSMFSWTICLWNYLPLLHFHLMKILDGQFNIIITLLKLRINLCLLFISMRFSHLDLFSGSSLSFNQDILSSIKSR